jgi:NADPH:quinone reductase-like Zn-dependent oxidoreductase
MCSASIRPAKSSKVGSGVSRFKIGDRVATIRLSAAANANNARGALKPIVWRARHIGLHRWGGYREYVSVPERNAFHIADI